MTWDYLAGFFDGEGHCAARINGARGTWQFVWQITQKDERVLKLIEEFLASAGFHPRWQPNKAKHCAVLSVYRVEEVQALLRELLPRLIVKYEQACSVLDAIEHRPRKGGSEYAAARRKTRPDQYRRQKGARLP